MIRKIITLGLIILTAFVFYKIFMADTLEPFFREHSGKVDLLQIKTSDYRINE